MALGKKTKKSLATDSTTDSINYYGGTSHVYTTYSTGTSSSIPWNPAPAPEIKVDRKELERMEELERKVEYLTERVEMLLDLVDGS